MDKIRLGMNYIGAHFHNYKVHTRICRDHDCIRREMKKMRLGMSYLGTHIHNYVIHARIRRDHYIHNNQMSHMWVLRDHMNYSRVHINFHIRDYCYIHRICNHHLHGMVRHLDHIESYRMGQIH